MKERTRNLIVGLTVLIGLVLLGSMIVIFRELPAFLRLGYYDVTVRFDHAGGVTPGADVLMAGKRVGRVTGVDFASQSDPRQGILFTIIIDLDVNVPGDVNVYIDRPFVGGTSIDLRSDGLPPGAGRTDPATGEKLAWIPKDRVVTIEGGKRPEGGPAQLIPPDLIADARGAMSSINRLAETLHEFFAPPPAARTRPAQPPATGPAQPVQPRNIHQTLAKLDKVLDDIDTVLGDEENQANLKAAFAKFRTAAVTTEEAMQQLKTLAADASKAIGDLSTSASQTSGRFRDVAASLIAQADRLGNVLTTIQRAATKVDSGEGTAGKLLNDPALYNSLVDAAAGMKGALAELRKLIRDWHENGAKIRLK